MTSPGLVYLLEMSGQALSQANKRINELTEQNHELLRQVEEFKGASMRACCSSPSGH